MSCAPLFDEAITPIAGRGSHGEERETFWPPRIRILKSRFIEVTRQAAAETTLDIYNVLREVGMQIPGEMRTLVLDGIHTTMTLAVIELLNSERVRPR